MLCPLCPTQPVAQLAVGRPTATAAHEHCSQGDLPVGPAVWTGRLPFPWYTSAFNFDLSSGPLGSNLIEQR